MSWLLNFGIYFIIVCIWINILMRCLQVEPSSCQMLLHLLLNYNCSRMQGYQQGGFSYFDRLEPSFLLFQFDDVWAILSNERSKNFLSILMVSCAELIWAASTLFASTNTSFLVGAISMEMLPIDCNSGHIGVRGDNRVTIQVRGDSVRAWCAAMLLPIWRDTHRILIMN